MVRIELHSSNFEQTSGLIEEFCSKHMPDSSEFCFKVKLVYEELMTNMFKHAIKHGTTFVDFEITKKGNENIEMVFIYDGNEFDPTTYKDKRIEESLEDKEKGGLGLFLVTNLSKSFVYEHKDGINTIHVEI
jgi:serine/threonine-protein kinase RsbW